MRKLSPTNLIIIAAGVILLLLAAVFLTRRGDPDQDKLTGDENVSASADDPEKRCASKATYDQIKRELFRRAAQVRGSDQAAFDRIAAQASIRMERPVMDSQDRGKGGVSCSGALSLDLPPGVAVVGGRRTLTADVDYALQRAADGSGQVLTLTNADAIITPLATLGRTGQPTATPVIEPSDPTYDGPGEVVPTTNTQPPIAPPPPPTPAPQVREQPVLPPPPPRVTSARPSFNCANARTRGERAVCADPGLASLDREMAGQFNRAMGEASPGVRQMLTRSRGRFLAFRDRCGSDACVADAYRGRMAEIRDIMSGRF